MIEKLVDVTRDLKTIIGNQWVITEKDMMEGYLRDESPTDICPSPASDLILVKPCNTKEVSMILKLANHEKIPVFPVGGRTGLSGGSVPTRSGLIISLERMNKIKVDSDNMMAIADSGATLSDLIKAAEDADLFFPLHPGDEGAQIGGLIATNAGGVRAIKHGIMRNFVKGLELVTSTGEVLSLGGELIKNNTGYNLMHLVIGSEGTLGVITKAVIRLFPKVGLTVTLIASFNDPQNVVHSVLKILHSGITPLAMEYVHLREMEMVCNQLKENWPVKKGPAQLIIILSEVNEDTLFLECEEIAKILEQSGVISTVIAETRGDQDRILKIRSHLYSTIKPHIYDIADVTVPPGRLADLIREVEAISEKYDTPIPIYGHVADGNLHAHVMKENMDLESIENVMREIYEAGVNLGGVITGEHGIGKVKIGVANLVLSEKEVELMRAIKTAFDPNKIMNPGTIAG